MSGVPKHEIMSPEEMRATEARKSRLYSQTSDHGLVVGEIVSNLAADLASMPRKKIDLKDVDLVRDIAIAYTDSCAKSGTICNKTGLCRAMGMSRQGVDWFLSHHAEEPSAELLRVIFDAFAEALAAAGLAGAVHPILSIFVMKAIYNFKEAIAVEPVSAADPLGNRVDMAALMSKYSDLGGLPE